MALSDSINARLNAQIESEFYSSQLYLAMACTLRRLGLTRLPAWFRRQAEEERSHALKILDYVLEADGVVELREIPAAPAAWTTALAAVQAAHDHERKVTAQIHELAELAEREKDYATRAFIDWFVTEQVEEESSTRQLLAAARMAGDHMLQLEAFVGQLMASQS